MLLAYIPRRITCIRLALLLRPQQQHRLGGQLHYGSATRRRLRQAGYPLLYRRVVCAVSGNETASLG